MKTSPLGIITTDLRCLLLDTTLQAFFQSSLVVKIQCTFARTFLVKHNCIALAVLKCISSQYSSLIPALSESLLELLAPSELPDPSFPFKALYN